MTFLWSVPGWQTLNTPRQKSKTLILSEQKKECSSSILNFKNALYVHSYGNNGAQSGTKQLLKVTQSSSKQLNLHNVNGQRLLMMPSFEDQQTLLGCCKCAIKLSKYWFHDHVFWFSCVHHRVETKKKCVCSYLQVDFHKHSMRFPSFPS
jgi:hypothetical protein